MKERDLAIDYAKGIAILVVYLGHSIIYHPIDLAAIYDWCNILGVSIESYNMPVFFLISGLLFGFSKKQNAEVFKDKVKRLFIPYLFAMSIVHLVKQFTPASMTYKSNVGGGIFDILKDVFLLGGDRWFVYVLMLIFLLSLPLRSIIKTKWVCLVLFITFSLSIWDGLPNILQINKVIRYSSFFFVGFYCSQYFKQIKVFLQKNVIGIVALFVAFNVIFIKITSQLLPVWYIVLPLIGSAFVLSMSMWLELYNKRRNHQDVILHYIEYCGKYSLQFYLFIFAYPIIRIVVVNVFHITQPFYIIVLVFLLQLVFITITIEITKRIKCLKLLMGY